MKYASLLMQCIQAGMRCRQFRDCRLDSGDSMDVRWPRSARTKPSAPLSSGDFSQKSFARVSSIVAFLSQPSDITNRQAQSFQQASRLRKCNVLLSGLKQKKIAPTDCKTKPRRRVEFLGLIIHQVVSNYFLFFCFLFLFLKMEGGA